MVDGDRVSVRLGASSGCSACDAGKGCGAGVFGRLLRRKPVVLDFENTVDAVNGQGVVVGLPESLFLSLTMRLYLYPLLAGLAGAVAGHLVATRLSMTGFSADMTALTGAVLSLMWVIRRNRQNPVEFPGEKAVHLLRKIECEISEK